MEEFTYTRPATADDATGAHSAAEDAMYMAGGQTLIPVLKQGLAMPTDVVDLNRVDDLAAIGALPVDELERRQQQLRDLEDSIASRNSQRERDITQQMSRISTLTATMQNTASISAPVAGFLSSITGWDWALGHSGGACSAL